MQTFESSIKAKFMDYQATTKLKTLTRLKLEGQRQASVPTVAIANNFDPDQKGFVTPGLAGYTAVQTEFGSTIVANGDFGYSPRYQNPDTDNVKFPFSGGRQIRPQPGQPVMVYRASATSPNASISFLRGGKAEPYRDYPSYPVLRFVHGEYASGFGIASLIYFRRDVTFATGNTWDSNSPLPPGVRWAEMNDIRYENTTGDVLALGNLISLEDLAAMYHFAVADLDQLLPQDRDGRPKVNIRPLPGNLYSLHPDIYSNDSYWTGQVRDPLNWNDSYWYGINNGVNKTLMEIYLNAHPGCRFV